MPRLTALALSAVLALPGCITTPVWHQTGANVQKLQLDFSGCEVNALREAPVDRRIARRPVYFVPAYYSHGRHYGGYWAGGETYTYDANEKLRKATLNECMAGKGYTRAALPRCESERIAEANPVSARMPPLTEDSCAARAVGGAWVVLR